MEPQDDILRLEKSTAEDGIRSFGELTNDPSNYVEELQNNMEYFSSRKQIAAKNKAFFGLGTVFLVPFSLKVQGYAHCKVPSKTGILENDEVKYP